MANNNQIIHMRIFRIIIVALLLAWNGLACAGWDEAAEALKQGDIETAFREILPLAAQGNAEAQFFLATMYGAGQGVPQDYKKSAEWLRKAAEQGNVKAQFNLGALYNEGQGVPQDYKEAAKWFRMAAEQGHVEAQFNLGLRRLSRELSPKA